MPLPLYLIGTELPLLHLLVTALIILCALGMVSVVLMAIFIQHSTAEKSRLVAQLLIASKILGRVAPLLEEIPAEMRATRSALDVTLKSYLNDLQHTREQTVRGLLQEMEKVTKSMERVEESVRNCQFGNQS